MEKTFISMNSCTKILVLYEIHSPEECLFYTSFIEDLKMRGKQVKCFALYHPKDKEMMVQECTTFFTPDELTWLKLPPENIKQEAKKVEENLLIDLTLNPSNAINYLTAQSKALMKVGRKTDSKEWLDMQIDTNTKDGVKYLAELIIHYLVCIKGSQSL